MQEEAALLKALAEPTRLRLAVLLARAGETCVCRLAEALEAPDFKISRHLAILRAAGIVAARRQGTWMHYKLREPCTRLEACLQECFQTCLADDETGKADRERLRRAACAGAEGDPAARSERHDA